MTLLSQARSTIPGRLHNVRRATKRLEYLISIWLFFNIKEFFLTLEKVGEKKCKLVLRHRMLPMLLVPFEFQVRETTLSLCAVFAVLTPIHL